MKEEIKLIIADDQTLFAECLRIAIGSGNSSINIIGIAGNGFEVIDILKSNNADIILMDIRMPEMDGLETLRRISSDYPHIKVIMLTTFAEDQYMHTALENGAKGFLLKDTNPKNLLTAIQMIIDDMIVFTDSVFDINDSTDIANFIFGSKDDLPEWYSWLSENEKKLLYYLKLKMYNKEISLKMNLSVQTVKNYISIIYSKIGIHSRKELQKFFL